jgi:periplasmic protein CpxP/Spy
MRGGAGGWMEKCTSGETGGGEARLSPRTNYPMKNQRIGLLLLIGATLAALPALRAADKEIPQGERRERMQQGAERMAEALDLTEAQKAKMKEISQREKAELDALRDSAIGAKEEHRAKAKAIHEKYRAERHALMTPEQQAKAEKMREKRGDMMEKRSERMEKRKERRE